MSRNAAGTYTAPANSVNPAVEGTTIDEGDFNAFVDDVESALTDSLDRTGKGKITAHIDFDENASPGTPASNEGRLYGGDDSGLTTLYWKDSSGNVYNLLQGAASGLTYQFATSTTTTSDPGAGFIRFNHATVSSVTEIAIDDNTAAGADVSAFILTWDDSGTSDRGRLYVQKRTAPGTIAIFRISGASVDESGWTRLAVTYVTHAGTFSANDPIAVSYGTPGSQGATGATGSAGANGANGSNGTDPGIRWLFDSSTTMADPGSGDLRLNNATLASVTAAAVSASSGETGNPSVLAFLQALDDSTTSAHRGYLIIKKASAPQNFVIFDITGALTDNTTWVELALTHVSSSGSFSAADVLSVQFDRTGDAGSGSLSSMTANGIVYATGAAAATSTGAATDGQVLIGRTSNTPALAALSGDVTMTNTGVTAIGATKVTNAMLAGSIDLTTKVTGALPVANGGSGATTLTGVVKGNGTSAFTAAAATDLGAGLHAIWVPATAMISRTTNGAAVGVVEMTTNKNMFRTLDYDTTTQEFAQFAIQMPKSWNESTVTAAATWSHASTTTNFGVVFGIEAVAISNDDAGDVAFGTAQTVADTGGTTNDIYVTAATSAITVGGTPAAEDWVLFQVKRVPADGSDTMAIDARLHGITLYITTDAITDA